jgi:hypothetical protein
MGSADVSSKFSVTVFSPKIKTWFTLTSLAIADQRLVTSDQRLSFRKGFEILLKIRFLDQL